MPPTTLMSDIGDGWSVRSAWLSLEARFGGRWNTHDDRGGTSTT